MLDEAQLEALRVACGGKIAVVIWNEHQIVFRRPTRDHHREWRRKEGTPEEATRQEELVQVMIAAFDGETDPVKARTTFTRVFLEEYPWFTDTAKCNSAVNLLTGMVEVEAEERLGKFARVLSGRPKATAKGSPNGSVTSSPEPISPTLDELPPS